MTTGNNHLQNGHTTQSFGPIETRLFINGEFVPSKAGKTFDVINPHKETVTATVQEAREEDVELAVQAAEAALEGWSALGGFERAAYFYRLAVLLEQNNARFAWLEAQSMGRPVPTYTEATVCARYVRYIAGKAADVQGESSLQTAGFMNVVLREPYGVCAAITPWNAPVTMLMFKLAPALIAGNTLVVKSSEKAPLTALFLASLAKEAGFPPGVLNILSGFGRPCGQAIAAHPRIRKISFTGSISAGRAIKAAALGNMKKVTLELGGKSPLIVFDDADITKAANLAARSVLFNSGQACIASSRVYVHKRVAEQFCRELVAAFQAHGYNPPGHNDPLSPSTKRGPQADIHQFDSIKKFLHETRESGVQFLDGGQAEAGKGYYIEPTVIYEPAEDSRVIREEVFGPVQCVCTFEDEDEVLRRANGTEYGLYASVFTRDIFRAMRVAKLFEAGAVGVNVTTFMTHDMPFGGWKQSGDGIELGRHQVEEWTHTKSVYFALS